MAWLVALWLALVHVLDAGRTALPLGSAAGGGSAAYAPVGAACVWVDHGSREYAVRAVHAPSVAAVGRGDAPRAGGPYPPAWATAPRVAPGADYAAAVRARALEVSHEAAARGALRPYDATAPPLQG